VGPDLLAGIRPCSQLIGNSPTTVGWCELLRRTAVDALAIASATRKLGPQGVDRTGSGYAVSFTTAICDNRAIPISNRLTSFDKAMPDV
jgi:hypothetical protein